MEEKIEEKIEEIIEEKIEESKDDCIGEDENETPDVNKDLIESSERGDEHSEGNESENMDSPNGVTEDNETVETAIDVS